MLPHLLSAPGTEPLALLPPLTPAWAATLTALVMLGSVWSKRPGAAAPAHVDTPSGTPDTGSDAWHRLLEVPLTAHRQVVLQQIRVSSNEIQADVQMLPFEGLKPAAQAVVDQQQRLIPEIERNLHLAEWLECRVHDLERRASGGPDEATPPRPRAQQSLMGIQVPVPDTDGQPQPTPRVVIPLDPGVQARLADIRERIARLDAEAERVAQLLVECEANLLATISEQDEHRLGELFAEFAGIFDMHYQVVREVKQEQSGA